MDNSRSSLEYDPTIYNPDLMKMYVNGEEELPSREEFYTNYPFYKYWNSESNSKLLSERSINIYLHIPFCIQICDYCFYMKELIKSKNQVDEYVDFLCKEIKLVSEKFNLANREVKSIYIGGGTPSVLTEAQFKKIMDALERHHCIVNPEFTVEAEPGTFSRRKMEMYQEYGVNRISMGVQSFDDEVIKLSSRKHSVAQALNSINVVNDVGGFEINIDLLSGLAGESTESWEKSVQTAMQQSINLLTIYKMKTYANTNFFKKGIHRNEIQLPSESEEIHFMTKALEMLFTDNFKPWSTFAFTKDGSQSRYIEYTWRGEDLIAYGASSFGKIDSYNYQNLNSIPLYLKRLKDGELPVYRSYSLTFKDLIVKELLLCSVRLFSYSISEFRAKFGFDYRQLIPEVITELSDKGFIKNNPDELSLTTQGILFGDFVSKVIASSIKRVFSNDNIGFVY